MADMPMSEVPADPLAEARAHLEAGRPQEALRLLEVLVEREPTNALAYQELARALAETSRRGPAARAARRALELDPTLARPHGVLAWIAVTQGRYEEALAEHRAQLEALPEEERERRAAVYNNMATCLFRMKRPQEALSALRQALALDSERPTYRYNLAMLLLHLRQAEEAQVELERLLSLPEVPPEIALMARFNLGHLYARQGRYGEARQQFLRAQEVRKTFPGWLYSRLPFLARFPAYLLLIILMAIALLFWNFFLRR